MVKLFRAFEMIVMTGVCVVCFIILLAICVIIAPVMWLLNLDSPRGS